MAVLFEVQGAYDRKVYVNPLQVTHVLPTETGCDIYLANGEKIAAKEDADMVEVRISDALCATSDSNFVDRPAL